MKTVQRLLKSKYRQFIFTFFAVILLLSVSLFVHIPNLQKVLENQQILKQKREELARLTQKRAVLQGVAGDDTRQYLKDAENALPDEKDATAVLTTLANIATSTNAFVERVELSPGLISSASASETSGKNPTQKSASPKSAGDTQILAASVAIRGTGSQFTDFLEQLYSSKRLFDIDDMVISFEPDSPDLLTATLTLKTFYLPPLSRIGSVEATLPQITPAETQALQRLRNAPNLSELTVTEAIQTSSFGKSNLFSQ